MAGSLPVRLAAPLGLASAALVAAYPATSVQVVTATLRHWRLHTARRREAREKAATVVHPPSPADVAEHDVVVQPLVASDDAVDVEQGAATPDGTHESGGEPGDADSTAMVAEVVGGSDPEPRAGPDADANS